MEHAFSGWFTDSSYDTPFTASATSGSQTVLYGKLCDLAVIFDAGEVPVFPKHKGVIHGKKYGELPEPKKTGYVCIGWEDNEGELITSESTVTINQTCTVYAVIVIGNYTLTFDFRNGSKVSSLATFNDTIVYPENVTRDGYTFKGWNDTVDRMPGYDLTIRAIWDKNRLPALVDAFIVISCLVSACAVVVVAVVLFARKKDENGPGYDLDAPLGKFSEN